MFRIDITIREDDWLKHPAERWNAGLEKAGINFRQGLQRRHYPPAPAASRYVRTYMTADKANFKITEPGKVMEFGSVSYLQFLLVPTSTVAHWAGTKDKLVELMQSGFKNGVATYHGGGA
ncbi:MAG TPA: hypothetical protein VJA21_10935 [Verrucomicrobiae bacterium]